MPITNTSPMRKKEIPAIDTDETENSDTKETFTNMY